MQKPLPVDRTRVGVLASAIAALVSGATFSGASLAQQQEAQPPQSLDEITVTGTRIRRDDYTTPNPVATFGSQEMRNLGIVNVADIMTQMPSNVSQFQAGNTGGSAFFIGATLANLRGLNPFFGTRTLTLVDSRRFVPTNQGGSVDLNFIPSVLIDRVETVTGGASASYGSDAISGVVNLLLDRDFDGVKIEADIGATSEGDGDNEHFGIAWGRDLFGDRGHLIVGGEFQTQDGIRDCATARDWCARGLGNFSNGTGGGAFDPIPNPHPYVQTIPGQPQNIIMENLRYPASFSGFVFNNTAAGTDFRINDAGTDVVPFDSGQFSEISPGGFATVIGGEGRSIYSGQTIYPDLDRKIAYAHLDYDFSESLAAYFELSYGRVEAFNKQDPPGQNTANVCIRPDNAYLAALSPAAQAEIAARIGQGFNPAAGSFACFGATTLVKDFTNQTDQTVTTDTEVTRAVIGFNGDLFSSDNWTWDAYYQYGETTRDQIGSDYRTNHRFTMASEAVVGPGGQIMCRVTRDGAIPGVLPVGADPSLAVGCVPMNPFGNNTLTDAAREYVYGDLTEFNTITQHVTAGSVSGQVAEGWAGPLLLAAGAEHRREKLSNDAGPLPFAQRTDFGLQYGDEFAGKVDVSEAFLEFEMPLLADAPGAELLMFNVAGRRAHYKNTGLDNTTRETVTQDVTSWKFSAIWDPVDWLRFRGSRSQDIRAAGFRELYYSQTIPSGGFFGAVTNPWLPDTGANSQRDESVLILSGNARLRPEEAKTTTLGFVLSPGGRAQGFQFSADHYEIKLKDGIVLGFIGIVLNDCFAGISAQCDFLTFGPPDVRDPTDPNSNVTFARTPYINSQPYEATGIDYSASYTFNLDSGANLSLRLLATHALETIVQAGGQTRDIAGQNGGDQGFLSDFAASPDWAANVIATYATDRFSITGQARYYSDGRLDKQNPKIGPGEPGFDPIMTRTVTNATVPSYAIWTLSGSYDLPVGRLDSLQLFGTIENLFDKDPPYSAGATGGTNTLLYDALGRNYRLGIRMNF
jgi:outer membrane receptor protein involved in Fe transport